MFIMLLSYVVSEYEYNNVKEQYQKAFNDANATFVQQVFTKKLNQTLNAQNALTGNGTNSTDNFNNGTVTTTKTMKKHKKKAVADKKAMEEDEEYK